MNKKNLLSTLWIFTLINMIYADILSLMEPTSAIRKIMAGLSRPPADLIVGAIIMEIPIMMILLSLILNEKWNRWISTYVCVLTILMAITGGHGGYYYLFASLETLTLLAIIGISWKRNPGENDEV